MYANDVFIKMFMFKAMYFSANLQMYLFPFLCPGVSAYVSERRLASGSGAPHSEAGLSRGGPLEVERKRRGLPAAPH